VATGLLPSQSGSPPQRTRLTRPGRRAGFLSAA
jgi:hypothetical protein